MIGNNNKTGALIRYLISYILWPSDTENDNSNNKGAPASEPSDTISEASESLRVSAVQYRLSYYIAVLILYTMCF